MKTTNKQILNIALPSIVSNITVPLLGLVDVTIVGHLGAASYIGAIAVGGMLFNIIYWIFGFLRLGTSGMTSQAYGKGDTEEVARLLIRSLAIGGAIAFTLIALQLPIVRTAFYFMNPTREVEALATTYFHICIWGAPAILGLYGLNGWFIGMQNSRIPMWIAITQNIVNILSSLCLVLGFGMKVEGVALGTLIAQYAGLVMALTLWKKHYGHSFNYRVSAIWQRKAMARFFSVNRDIFLRTLFLVAVTVFFTSAGAAQGEVILAVNTLLMQLFTLFSYIMDGFANAGEALCGKHIGAKNGEELRRVVWRIFGWGAVLSLLFTLTYLFGGESFLKLLTNETEVIAATKAYYGWAVLIPFAGMAAFIWDGIFIGATATREMLVSIAVAAFVFFGLYYGLREMWGNHALWLAFISYLALRGVVQTLLCKKLFRF